MLMKHVRGGWHYAADSEVEEMEQNGWVKSSEEERKQIIASKLRAIRGESGETENQTDEKPGLQDGEDREAIVALYVAKHGKKPHHKLSIEKLREAVKE